MTQNCARIRHNFLPCAGEYASTTPSHTIMVVTSNENATLKSKKQWKERKKFHITKGRNLSPFPSISSSGYRFRKRHLGTDVAKDMGRISKNYGTRIRMPKSLAELFISGRRGIDENHTISCTHGLACSRRKR